MFDLINETWTCLGESVPSYQCEPIVATGQLILLSNRNDTQMLHTYRLRMQQQDEFTNGQIMKMTVSSDDLISSAASILKEKNQLSRVRQFLLSKLPFFDSFIVSRHPH